MKGVLDLYVLDSLYTTEEFLAQLSAPPLIVTVPQAFDLTSKMVLCWPVECTMIWIWFHRTNHCNFPLFLLIFLLYFLADISSWIKIITYFEGITQNLPVFCSVAVLHLMGQAWLSGFSHENIFFDVLIGWSCLSNCHPRIFLCHKNNNNNNNRSLFFWRVNFVLQKGKINHTGDKKWVSQDKEGKAHINRCGNYRIVQTLA